MSNTKIPLTNYDLEQEYGKAVEVWHKVYIWDGMASKEIVNITRGTVKCDGIVVIPEGNSLRELSPGMMGRSWIAYKLPDAEAYLEGIINV